VLAVGLIVSAAGIAAMDAALSRLAIARAHDDGAAAAAAAQSALELALQIIAADHAWWEAVDPAGGAVLIHQIGAATVSVQAFDPADADLSTGDFDPISLTAFARVGDAERTVQAVFDRVYTPLPALRSSARASGAVQFDTGVRVRGPRPVGTNNRIDANAATVETPVEAALTVAGSAFLGGSFAGAPALTIPGAASINTFKALATRISRAALPSSRIERALVSPQHNPAGGPVNPLGIYLIDCAGANLQIIDSRIYGTLIIENASAVTVTGAVVMQPLRADLPTLLVQGPLDINLSNIQLSEASAGRNMNPPGAPYQGLTDADSTDSYPVLIQGLVHATGDVRIGGAAPMPLTGVLLSGGTLRFSTQSVFAADSALDATPPAGYRDGPAYRLRASGWIRVP
jgi:hypothetical protein